MWSILKTKIETFESSIISVEYSFESALNILNQYIEDNHNSNETIYREKENRFTCYSRGFIYGRNLLYVYEIVQNPIDFYETIIEE
jgi:hypothetical protein